MYSNEIIVSSNSFESNKMTDIIYSNAHFLDRLFKQKIKKNEISDEAMQSYYVNFYYINVKSSGFCQFMYNYYPDKILITNIEHALHNLGCFEHLYLFNQIMHFIDKIDGIQNVHQILRIDCLQKEGNIFNFFDNKFTETEKKESLVELNYKWLMNHSNLIIVPKERIRDKVVEIYSDILERYKRENPKHLQIIKALCAKAREKYKCITAGDPNNIYHSSWYFKTESGHFYMIEKNREAKMYSSKTKELITSISTSSYYSP